MVDALGQVPVVSDASDLRVVLELLLQLLVVVDGRSLSGRQLDMREEERTLQRQVGEERMRRIRDIVLVNGSIEDFSSSREKTTWLPVRNMMPV